MVSIESLVGGNSIQGVVATSGVAGFTGNDLNYTAPTDFCGCDLIDVTVVDGSSRTKTMTVGFNIDDKPLAVDDNFVNTGSFTTLDVLANGDADPVVCYFFGSATNDDFNSSIFCATYFSAI